MLLTKLRNSLIGMLFALLIYNLFTSGIYDRPLTLDEGISYWLIQLTPAELIQQTYLHQGYSPAYFLLLKAWATIFSSSDFSLKALSLLAFLGSGICIYLTTRLFASRTIALLGVSFLLASVNSLYSYLIVVRPYGLVFFFISLGFYFLCKSLDESIKTYLLSSSLSVALAISLHYISALALIPFIITIILNKKKATFDHSHALSLILAIFPLFIFSPHLLWLYQFQSDIGIKQNLNFTKFFKTINDQDTFYSILILLIISMLFLKSGLKNFIIAKKQAFSFLAFFIPPLILFVAHYYFGISLFIYKYFIWYAIGKFLLLALILNHFCPQRFHSYLLLCFLTFSCFIFLPEKYGYSRWDEVISTTNNYISTPEQIVLLHSGLQELSSKRIFNDPDNHPYLNSITARFPLNGQVITIPTRLDFNSDSSPIEKEIMKVINKTNDFYLVTSNYPFNSNQNYFLLSDYYLNFFQELGFSATYLYQDPLNSSIKFSRT